MPRCAPSTSTTSDQQLGADGHVPIIGGHSGAIQRADRSSDTPGTSPPVGAERSRMVDLKISTLRSCNRCAGQLALVARPEARCLQDRRVKVLHGIAPEYLGPVVRVADLPASTVSSLCWH